MSKHIDSITRELTFSASIDTVWSAISDPTEVAMWFGSAANFELSEGALGYFEWQQECEGRFAMRIEKIDAPSYLAWRWMHKQNLPFNKANSTLVEWKLKQTAQGGTQLIMTESGFAEAKHYQENTQGWEQELGDLQQYLRS